MNSSDIINIRFDYEILELSSEIINPLQKGIIAFFFQIEHPIQLFKQFFMQIKKDLHSKMIVFIFCRNLSYTDVTRSVNSKSLRVNWVASY